MKAFRLKKECEEDAKQDAESKRRLIRIRLFLGLTFDRRLMEGKVQVLSTCARGKRASIEKVAFKPLDMSQRAISISSSVKGQIDKESCLSPLL